MFSFEQALTSVENLSQLERKKLEQEFLDPYFDYSGAQQAKERLRTNRKTASEMASLERFADEKDYGGGAVDMLVAVKFAKALSHHEFHDLTKPWVITFGEPNG